MNRRQLFLTTAKAALASAFGGSWLFDKREAKAQTPGPGAGAASQVRESLDNAVGSPDGTRTIPGDVLPAPDLPFGGTINLNAAESKPWWQPRVVPPVLAQHNPTFDPRRHMAAAGDCPGGLRNLPWRKPVKPLRREREGDLACTL